MTLDLDTAALRLCELGHPTRLRIMRELVRLGEAGVPVSYLQSCLDIPASTLSHHLRHLKSAELITQRRQATTLYCTAEFDHIRALAAYLTEECCAAVEAESRPANDA